LAALEEAVVAVQLGASQDLPSVGSALHGSGRCKPCAFIFKKGCMNGVECEYCHLCEPGEKKKRQRLKIESQRKGRRSKQAPAQLATDPLCTPEPEPFA